MRIIELKAENFKKLIAVAIRPTGAVTPITGKNGAGKTSVLDAFAAALGGASLAPELPIRKGEAQSQVILTLDALVVTRKWTAKGSTLEVTSREGAVFKSPQSMLDKLVGELSFDPLHFAAMKPADQANTLARVAGIDLDAHKARRLALYAERADLNKQAKELKALVDAMPPLDDDLPAEEVSIAAVMDELSAAESANRLRVNHERAVAAAEAQEHAARQAVENVRRQLDQAERQLVEREHNVVRAREVLADAPPLVDVEPIKQRGRQAESINRQIRARDLKTQRQAKLLLLAGDASAKTEEIDRLDVGLTKQLASAALPVPGLGLAADGVQVAGVPFSQCSGAERLRVSVALGLALNPKLKLMLIRDGSLLDDDGMRLLAELAEAADAQVLIERVSNGDGVGIRIEDGHVAELGAANAADPFPVA